MYNTRYYHCWVSVRHNNERLYKLHLKDWAQLTEYNDEDVGDGEGDEIVVHGGVQALAADHHGDHGEVPQQPGDEDNDVENCDKHQKTLKLMTLR